MFVPLLALAAAIPSVADLRVQGVRTTWERCIRLFATEFEMAEAEPGPKVVIPPEAVVEAGKSRCASFENDYRDALVIYAPEFLKNKGVTTYSASVVNLLAESSLQLFSSKMIARLTLEFSKPGSPD